MTGDDVIARRVEAREDLVTAWRWISQESYWGRGIPWAAFDRACARSLCFGLYVGGRLCGFARVVTDTAVFGWLCDVFIAPDARGQGHGIRLLSGVFADPDLQGLRRWGLATGDAQSFYARFGFSAADPAVHMERVDPTSPARNDLD